MSRQQVSVRELKEYWKYVESVKPGEGLDGYIEPSRMPPWDEICSELDWHLYRIGGGRFRKKHHGLAKISATAF
jgi:hypothetical protein